MIFKRDNAKRIIWTEEAIALYERRLEAVASIGSSWLLHPDNAVYSKRVIHLELTEKEWRALQCEQKESC